MHAHRQRRRRRRKNVYLTSVGSAALPESEASNYTYTKVQWKTTEGTREKTEGRGETRERMRRRERERAGTGIWGQGVGKGVSCWSCAYDHDSCHVSGCGNQSPRADLAPSPCCAPGLHSVRGHHTEPRKTCSRVWGFCNSAIMKREFVQPCAGQNSEFTFAQPWTLTQLSRTLNTSIKQRLEDTTTLHFVVATPNSSHSEHFDLRRTNHNKGEWKKRKTRTRMRAVFSSQVDCCQFSTVSFLHLSLTIAWVITTSRLAS